MSIGIIVLGFLLMIICAVFVTLFLMAFYRGTYIRALVFKGIASMFFVTFGGINCFINELSPSSLLIFIGLCLGIIGDEVIALCQVFPDRDTRAFIGGGSSFLVGHILYILALSLLGGVNWIALIISFVLIASAGLIYERYRRFLNGEMKFPLTLYLGIVVLVFAVATGVFFKRFTLGAALFSLGGLLFTVSDNVLFAYKLGERPRFLQNVILHIAYYLAQFLIAWSISLL